MAQTALPAPTTNHRPPTTAFWLRLGDSLPPVWVCVLVVLSGTAIPLGLLYYNWILTIGGIVGLLVAALVVSNPYFGLLLFLALLYTRPEEMFPALAGARMTLVISLIAMFAWLINGLLCRERFRLHLPAIQVFLVFVLIAIFSTAVSGSGRLGEEIMELLKLLILFVLVTHLLRNEARVHGAMVALVLFTAILGAQTIVKFQRGDALVQSDGSVRALGTGIFGDPNDLALAMAMAIPLALGIGFGLGRAVPHQRVSTRILCLAAVPILIWTIYVTDSRGGMVALAAAIFLYFRRRLGRTGLILGTIAVLGLFTLGPSRMSQMSADEESAHQRVEAWQAGSEMLRSSPIWGVGKSQFTEHHYLTAHNSVVLCLAELGLAGTMMWLALFYFVFRDNQRVAALQRSPGGRLGADRRPLDLTAHRSPQEVSLASSRRVDLVTSETTSLHRGERRAVSDEPGAQRPPISPWNRSSLVQISLITFLIGGFFLSRTYTPPLYVYMGLALAATQVEAEAIGATTGGASLLDWGRIVGLTLGSVVLVQILIKVWG